MRVLLSCLQSPLRHPGIPAYDFWREYFVRGCEEAGLHVVEVPDIDWALGLAVDDAGIAQWRKHTWERTVEFACREHAREPFALFLSYLFPRQIDPEAIEALMACGIPCVNFFCDNVRDFVSMPHEFRPFALHWVPEAAALPMYRGAGMQVVHAPMPCWVPPGSRSTPAHEDDHASFIGSRDVLRESLLGAAIALGADLHVHGNGWTGRPETPALPPVQASGWAAKLRNQWRLARDHGPSALAWKIVNRIDRLPAHPPLPKSRLHSPPDREGYVRISRESAVTLGINRVPTYKASLRRPITYSRLRDIEAPMLGACYLTEWTPDIPHLYEEGREIATYRSPDELVEQLQRLLADQSLRRRMRSAAQRRALQEHSIPTTLRRITRELGASPTQGYRR